MVYGLRLMDRRWCAWIEAVQTGENDGIVMAAEYFFDEWMDLLLMGDTIRPVRRPTVREKAGVLAPKVSVTVHVAMLPPKNLPLEADVTIATSACVLRLRFTTAFPLPPRLCPALASVAECTLRLPNPTPAATSSTPPYLPNGVLNL